MLPTEASVCDLKWIIPCKLGRLPSPPPLPIGPLDYHRPAGVELQPGYCPCVVCRQGRHPEQTLFHSLGCAASVGCGTVATLRGRDFQESQGLT